MDEDLKIGGFTHNKVSIESIICNLGYFYKVTKIFKITKKTDKIVIKLQNDKLQNDKSILDYIKFKKYFLYIKIY